MKRRPRTADTTTPQRLRVFRVSQWSPAGDLLTAFHAWKRARRVYADQHPTRGPTRSPSWGRSPRSAPRPSCTCTAPAGRRPPFDATGAFRTLSWTRATPRSGGNGQPGAFAGSAAAGGAQPARDYADGAPQKARHSRAPRQDNASRGVGINYARCMT